MRTSPSSPKRSLHRTKSVWSCGNSYDTGLIWEGMGKRRWCSLPPHEHTPGKAGDPQLMAKGYHFPSTSHWPDGGVRGPVYYLFESSPLSQEADPVTDTFFTDEETGVEGAACPRSPRDLNSGLSDTRVLGSPVLCCQPITGCRVLGEGLSLPRLSSKNTLNPQEEEVGVNPDVVSANRPGSGSETYSGALSGAPEPQGSRGEGRKHSHPRSVGAVCLFPASTPQNRGQQMLSKWVCGSETYPTWQAGGQCHRITQQSHLGFEL